jgi:hypothetical protein
MARFAISIHSRESDVDQNVVHAHHDYANTMHIMVHGVEVGVACRSLEPEGGKDLVE